MIYAGSEIEYKTVGRTAEISKVSAVGSQVVLPDEIDGLSVSSIGRYALSGLRNVKKVVLPKNITKIESLAFYNDRGLEELDLPRNVYRIGGDAFKNCDGIKRVTLKSERLLRYVLDELLQEVEVVFKNEENKTLWVMIFPVNAESFSEDVPGRAFHRTFTGPGYAYRKETAGSEVRFKNYDMLFKRSVEEETEDTLCRLAIYRLLYPFKLEEEFKEEYREYLKENALAAFKAFLKAGIFKGIYYMVDNKLLDEKAAEACGEYARLKKNGEMLGLLMDYKLKNFSIKKKKFVL